MSRSIYGSDVTKDLIDCAFAYIEIPWTSVFRWDACRALNSHTALEAPSHHPVVQLVLVEQGSSALLDGRSLYNVENRESLPSASTMTKGPSLCTRTPRGCLQ